VSRLYQHSPRQLRIARERLDKASSELQVPYLLSFSDQLLGDANPGPEECGSRVLYRRGTVWTACGAVIKLARLL